MLTYSHQWMQDDRAEKKSGKKARSEPAVQTSDQTGCEVSGTVMILLEKHHRGL